MSEMNSVAAATGNGTELTRFNALRHGVLSRAATRRAVALFLIRPGVIADGTAGHA